MLTTWDYSLETEAARLIDTAHGIATGLFRLNHFIVLPQTSKNRGNNIILFPDLPYLTIPRFWDRVARMNPDVTPDIIQNMPSDLLSEVKTLLQTAHLKEPGYTQIKSLWTKHESEIINLIYQTIPSLTNKIQKITIWPSVLGSNCSFNICNTPPYEVKIWLREDQGVAGIVEALLSSLTRQSLYDQLGGVWSESEMLVDWLLTFSPLASYLQKIDPKTSSTLTLKSTRSTQQASLTQISQNFLQKIGAPSANPTNVDLTNFSPRERDLMQILITSSPNPVTIDQIGDILFKNNPDEFSLYAVSKSIQRLRDKLEQNGISGSFIQTKRGEGYLLIS